MYTTRVSEEPVTGHQHVSTPFGLLDDKGRHLGFWYTIQQCHYAASDGPYGYTCAPGTYYEVSTHVTRNERPFGAANPRRQFDTRDQAVRYVVLCREDARKRSMKRYGK